MKTRYTIPDREVVSVLRGAAEWDHVSDPLGSTVALLKKPLASNVTARCTARALRILIREVGISFCLLFAGSCASTHRSAPNRVAGSPKPVATSKEFDRINKRVDQVWGRIDSKGAADVEAWRLILNVMDGPDDGSQQMVFPLLLHLVELRPMYKPAALALMEEKAIRADRADAIHKNLILTELAVLMGVPVGGEKFHDAVDHQSRIEASRRVDDKAAKFAEDALADRSFNTQANALLILLQAVALRYEDRSWALKCVERQILTAKGPEKRFWKVTREAMTEQMEDR